MQEEKSKGIEKLKEKVKEIKEGFKEKDKELKERRKEVKGIDEKDKKIGELIDTLQRLQAEFENYKKYVEKQKSGFVKYAKEDLIVKILPILDSFEMALKNTDDKEKFVKGVELIFSQLYQLLENEGLKPIEALGKTFDPYKHEVLLTQESDKEEDTILEELQKGYILDDKVIRHTKVKVAKKKSGNNANNKTDKAK